MESIVNSQEIVHCFDEILATTIGQTSPGNTFFSAQSPHALGSTGRWSVAAVLRLGVVVHLLACSGIQFDVSRSVSDELPFKKSGALPGNLKGVGHLRMDARSKMDLGCAMIQLSRCVWRCLETDTRAYMAYAAYMSYNVRQGYRYWVAYFFPPNSAMPSV